MKTYKIKIDVSINGSPPYPPTEVLVKDGDWIHVYQPVIVNFAAEGPTQTTTYSHNSPVHDSPTKGKSH